MPGSYLWRPSRTQGCRREAVSVEREIALSNNTGHIHAILVVLAQEEHSLHPGGQSVEVLLCVG